MTWISNAELIAKGSFGRVFKIHDPRSGEARALKVAVATNGAEAMLLAEFEQLGKLEHPSLPRVFEVGRTPAFGEVIDSNSYMIAAAAKDAGADARRVFAQVNTFCDLDVPAQSVMAQVASVATDQPNASGIATGQSL